MVGHDGIKTCIFTCRIWTENLVKIKKKEKLGIDVTFHIIIDIIKKIFSGITIGLRKPPFTLDSIENGGVEINPVNIYFSCFLFSESIAV